MRIGNLWIENDGDRTKLCAEVQVTSNAIERWKKNTLAIDKDIATRYRTDFLTDKESCILWFSVPKEYQEALCSERSDAFVVACLYFAMMAEEDIICDVPITENLLYQINHVLIPAMDYESHGLKRIYIKADEAPEIAKIAGFNGTGVSCGVDSFSTILLHLEKDMPANQRLTHVAVFNTGALNYAGFGKEVPLAEWRLKTLDEFEGRIEIGKKVADELKLGFIDVDSNLPEFYQGAFSYSHTLRNCSAVLATQKMWGNYYYASAGWGIQLMPSLYSDACTSDLIVLPNISLPALHFYSGGMSMRRLDKTQYISDKPIVQKYLNVCAYEVENCGHCVKCIRTMLALDILGKLADFRESFPHQEYYYKTKWKYMGAVLDKHNTDLFMQEIRDYVLKNSIHIEMKAKLYHYLRPIRMVRSWLMTRVKK